jgi:hypothetical protein
MSAYERVAIHRNREYKHNGTKSYVFAMSKCKYYCLQVVSPDLAQVSQMASTLPSPAHISIRNHSSRKESSEGVLGAA